MTQKLTFKDGFMAGLGYKVAELVWGLISLAVLAVFIVVGIYVYAVFIGR